MASKQYRWPLMLSQKLPVSSQDGKIEINKLIVPPILINDRLKMQSLEYEVLVVNPKRAFV